MPRKATPDEILSFWYEESTPKQWFMKDDAFDAAIATRFKDTVEAALAGQLDRWVDNAEGCLALILVLDQFTRNIFRNSPRAFSGDEMASALSLRCVERGYIEHDTEEYRTFMLMPMMHSESIEIQDRSLPLFKKWTPEQVYEYAVKHRDIVARFGHFPHRNSILGRPSTPEEVEFLKEPGSSF